MENFDLKLWDKFLDAHKAQDSISQNNSTIIDQIAIDSRRIDSKNSLFVALQGSHQDGHQHVLNAAKAGARFALVQKTGVPLQSLHLSKSLCFVWMTP